VVVSFTDVNGIDVSSSIVTVENNNTVEVEVPVEVPVVEPAATKVTVSPSNIKEGEVEKIDITLSSNGKSISGLVIVNFDGTNYAAVVTNGKATISVKNLKAGTYNVLASFAANSTYAASNASSKFTVSSYSAVDLDISADDGNLIVDLSDASGNGMTAKVNVTIDGKAQVLDVENGSASLPLDAGTHEVSVTYPGDSSHAPASGSKNLTVVAKTIETVLTVSAVDMKYGGAATVNFTLKDVDGNNMDETIAVVINGEEQNCVIKNGVGSVKVSNILAGNYTVIASYDGESPYLSSTGSADFNVAKLGTQLVFNNLTTTSFNSVIEGRIGEYFTARLLDENGKALAGKNVSVGFNGHVYKYTTNATGGFKTQVNLRHSTNYTFAIFFGGDENYESAFGVAKIEVLPQIAKFSVDAKRYKANAKSKTLTATVLSAYGTPIKGKVVSFVVDGRYYSAKTSASGIAKVKVSLSKKGTYKVTAKFEGDDGYAAITKTSTVKIV
uniref:Ig-like domain-containing protein n=1 Tax=uncultured Methanobrevibacter sp. TaxID=253161 RepID=UPI0026228F03